MPQCFFIYGSKYCFNFKFWKMYEFPVFCFSFPQCVLTKKKKKKKEKEKKNKQKGIFSSIVRSDM